MHDDKVPGPETNAIKISMQSLPTLLYRNFAGTWNSDILTELILILKKTGGTAISFSALNAEIEVSSL